MRFPLRLAISLALLGSTAPLVAQDTAAPEPRHLSSLRQMITTVNAGDAAGYARVYAIDAVITIYGGETITGRSAIEQYEAGLMREFPGTRLAFYSVWQAAPVAIVHYGVNGPTPDGRAMGHEGLLFFRFDRAGAIVEERRYLDSLTPMAQLGALGKTAARPLPVLPKDLTAYTSGNPGRQNVATVIAALGAIESRNADAFLARSAASITIDELMLSEPFSGRVGASRWLGLWQAGVPDLKLEVTNALAVGDDVLIETMARGTLTGPIGRLAATNKPFAVHRAMVVQVKNNSITQVRSFMNGKELAMATGQWPIR